MKQQRESVAATAALSNSVRRVPANGLLVRALPFIDVSAFSPARTISRTEIDEGIERYGRASVAARPVLDQLPAGLAAGA
ncbi:hypothetical protein [Candidatus Rariloculus sp.]|uniref:hypothetical protein n=1 Tax=Candidatus Rariloculus sp. TaxID=3101265 RepID=UPI003D127F3E